MIQSERQRKQTGIKPNEQGLSVLCNHDKRSTIYVIRVLEKKMKEGKAESLFKGVM